MSNQCDCGDPECAICGGRPRKSTAFVDPYMEQKAREDAARKAAQQAQPAPVQAPAPVVSAPPAPAVPVVQVETPVVAQLASAWVPPVVEDTPPVPVGVPIPPVPSINPPKEQSAFARAYTLWQQECVKRKEWIAALKQEWKQAVVDQDLAIAQWKAHVAAKRAAYEAASRTEPPPAPRKEQHAS